MKAILLAILLIAAGAAMAQERMDIKGIAVGMQKGDLLGKYPDLRCFKLPDPGWREGCTATRANDHANMSVLELDTYAGRRPTGVMILVRDDKVTSVQVELKGEAFVDVTGALAERWGKPTVETSTVQNRMGASFQQETHTWRSGSESIRARKLGRKLDVMDVTLMSLEAVKEEAEQRKQRAKDAKKDL